MRKQILTLGVIALGVLVCTQLAIAGPTPVIGDKVSLSGGNGINGGGIFNLAEKNGGYTLQVFCIEYMEHISLNTYYNISNISQDIYNGGNGSSFVSLNYKVDYLYMLFATGGLSSGLYNGSASAQADLQAALWFLQYGYGSANDISNYINGLNLQNQDYGTRVINLQDDAGNNKQSQLYRPPASVPEPSSLILLGLGLLGVGSATFRKKR